MPGIGLVPRQRQKRLLGRTLGLLQAGAMTRALLLLASCLVLWGCPRRIDYGPQGRIDDPEALLRLLGEGDRQVVTLEGESRIRVDTPEARGAFSMFVALARPALVHLEPLDFFGRPQAVLVVNGDRFGLYQAQDNRYYHGPASPQNVSRFLPIALPPGELTQIMLGQAPLLPHQRLSLEVDDQRCLCYRLTLHRGEVTQLLEVDPRLLRVRRSQVRGVAAYDLEFGDFLEQGTVIFPRRVRLRAEHAKVDFDLRYQDVVLNQAPDLTLFDLEPPQDVPAIEVDTGGLPIDTDVPPPQGPTLTPLPAEPPGD
jgi:hypothetical protein